MRPVVVVYILAMFGLAGCASTLPEGTADGMGFVQFPVPSLPDGVSDHQVEVADEFARSGDVSYEDYQIAMYDALQCVENAGISVTSSEVTVIGVRQIIYGIAVPPEWTLEDGSSPQTDAIFFSCMDRYADYTQQLYFSQNVPAAFDELYARYRPAILGCLREYGVLVADDASSETVDEAVADLIASEPGFNGPNCVDESGLNDELHFPAANW